MSCCGNKRAHYIEQSDDQEYLSSGVYVEYTGLTSLVVIGPASRRRYYFAATGIKLLIDRNDVRSLMTIPSLKKVP